MKQVIYTVFPVMIALFLGSLFMDVSRETDATPVIKEVNEATLFKIGSYEEKGEAEKIASLNKGTVLHERPNYIVVMGILKTPENINRMSTYLKKEGLYYETTKVSIPNNFKENLEKYEELMFSSTSDVAFLQLNKKILERYEKIYES